MQRPAKPWTPVRFRPPPPEQTELLYTRMVELVGCGDESELRRKGTWSLVSFSSLERASKTLVESHYCPDGEIGRHKGLKIPRALTSPCRFDSGSGHQTYILRRMPCMLKQWKNLRIQHLTPVWKSTRRDTERPVRRE